MKRNILLSTFVLLTFLFISCQSTRIPESVINIEQPDFSNKQELLKIYCPEFEYTNKKTQKKQIVSGDCTIVILPDNKCMVVDAFSNEAGKDLSAFIKSLGITKIDYLIASHYHRDHIGGMLALINNFEIGAFYSNGVPFDSTTCDLFLDLLDLNNIKINVLKEGDIVNLTDDGSNCRIELLWPSLTEDEIYDVYCKPGNTEKKANSTSLVFKLIYKDFSFLFTGDMYKAVDKALIQKYPDKLKSTILKAPHHGEFYTANSRALIKTVKPDYVVVEDPQYICHVICKRYERQNVPVLFRRTPGYILLQSDGVKYSIETTKFQK